MVNLGKAIRKELEQHKEIKVVSFDIFDTIVFRMVYKPEDVFEKVGQKAVERGILANHITPVIYKNIRKEAEKAARNNKRRINGTNEVTLEEIVEFLPSYCCNRSELLKLEVELEAQICYINPDFKEIIDFFRNEKNYTIILTSDMYMSEGQITQILESNGFPLELIDAIYVSSEVGKNKENATLYQHILQKRHWNPQQVLHIGDNYMTDVVNAKYMGIHTIYYDVINSDKYMQLHMEQIKYGELVPELYALRRYVADQAEEFEQERKEWFQIGAMIMGPLMAGTAEWVLDTAEKDNIKNIYPLMREGMILSKLLNQAAEYRTDEFHIEPMYVSRRALLLPSMGKWDEAAYEKLYETKERTVATILEVFQLQDEVLEQYKDVTLENLKNIRIGNQSGEEYLKKYLFSPEIQMKISKKINNEKQTFLKYLERLDIKDKFITVDFGRRGTMQKALSEFLGKPLVHLLMFGAYDCLQKLLDNIDIRGYVGNAGDNEKLIFDVIHRPYVWEQLMMCDAGTTIGYTDEGKPITKQIKQIGQSQLQRVTWCHDGMLAFQREYLKLKSAKKELSKLTLNPQKTACIALRMITMPTVIEAQLLGEMKYDVNDGIDSVEKICSEEQKELVKNMGADSFVQNSSKLFIPWLEGLVTQVNKTYYVDRVLEQTLSSYDSSIMQIVKKVLKTKAETVVVCGAGEAGRMMQKYLELYGIGIEAFTDNNVKLQGSGMNGIPVKSLKDEFRTNHYVIASFAYADEIEEQIRKLKGLSINLYRI